MKLPLFEAVPNSLHCGEAVEEVEIDLSRDFYEGIFDALAFFLPVEPIQTQF